MLLIDQAVAFLKGLESTQGTRSGRARTPTFTAEIISLK